MKRRKFVAAAATSSLISPLAFASSTYKNSGEEVTSEVYELQSFELTFGGNKAALMSYLKEIKGPHLRKMGASHFMLFTELGDAEPAKVWSLAAFPGFQSYENTLSSQSQEDFISQSRDYASAGKTYNRISSSLLYAFDGLKQMLKPIEGANLFEMRIYEGINEDAVHRKIKMFNKEEIELFYKVDLNPVFFGNMVIGPYVPSLVYMLNFRDMDHREAAWKKFIDHPDWNTMKVKDEYANSVSNIRKIFLKQV